jgi:phosphoenolpyruvate carboxykinase (ATP)
MPQYHVNLTAPELVQWALKLEKDTVLSERGALSVRSYLKTGRSPSDKRIVPTDDVVNNVDWGNVNIKLSEESFQACKARAIAFLERQEHLFVVNCFAGHDPRYQLKIRVVTSRPYHALFMRNMLIIPTEDQLYNFGTPDYVIYNAGEEWADEKVPGLTSKTVVALNFKTREQIILGTQYAGEMKKGVLTVMFELMPRAGHLTMHASANEGKKSKDVTVFFGLSGTGKTTLSADPHRALIGDDEHVWTDNGVFNIEGGCYAKAIGLNPDTEFDIWNAVRFGSVAENCDIDPKTQEINFMTETICRNTRVAYPLNFIDGSKKVAVGNHPKNIVFLTNDAFGVMPPIAKLTPEQAMFWFVTGYTSKVPGVEAGVNEIGPTFSPCFGGPFLVRSPMFYGKQLADKMRQYNTSIWLLNTGYAGGVAKKGGERMELKITRALLDRVHDGYLDKAEYKTIPGWGLRIPVRCDHPNIPDTILDPVQVWKDKAAFVETTNKLIQLFQDNFNKRFAKVANDEIRRAVPQKIGAPGSKL